jgi:hypothetical protein
VVPRIVTEEAACKPAWALDPEAKTRAVPASGELRLVVPARRAMILVPR